MRQEKAVPILEAFKISLEDKLKNESKYHNLFIKAVKYTINQWEYLTAYTQNGDWPIDNNLVEREIRPIAVGRKNWMFSDTPKGADASALIFSLMLTCRANQVNPYEWLTHVFTELPQRETGADITDLLPFNYTKKMAIQNVKV